MLVSSCQAAHGEDNNTEYIMDPNTVAINVRPICSRVDASPHALNGETSSVRGHSVV